MAVWLRVPDGRFERRHFYCRAATGFIFYRKFRTHLNFKYTTTFFSNGMFYSGISYFWPFQSSKVRSQSFDLFVAVLNLLRGSTIFNLSKYLPVTYRMVSEVANTNGASAAFSGATANGFATNIINLKTKGKLCIWVDILVLTIPGCSAFAVTPSPILSASSRV